MTLRALTRDATPDQRLWRYIAGWALAALVGCTGTALLGASTAPPPASLVVALLALTAAAEASSTILRARDRQSPGMSLSLLEFAVAVDLLLLPTRYAVAVVVCSVLATHLFRVRGLQKLVFNTAQHAVAASVSAAIVALVPATVATISVPRAAAVTLGVLAYSATNSFALARLFSILDLPQMREQLTDRPGFVLATAFGSASVGIVGAALWTAYPSLTFMIVGPALALYLSYGSSFRMKALLGEVSSERDHLDRVVSGIQEGIVLLDDRGVVRLWNSAMVRITGTTAEDALGRSAAEVMAGVDDEGVSIDPAHVLQDGQDSAVYTVTLTDTAGEAVDTRVEHTLVHDERGRCIGDVLMVQDLSREREAHSLKEDFVARVSHELRTPLSPLRGYAQLMLSAGDRISPEKRDDMLRTMVERVGHLERLIEDLLLVSRVSSGSVPSTDEISPEAVPLGEVVTQVTDWVGRDHPGRDIRVVSEGDDLTAWADPLRVGQIVTNLLTNACKYATPDTPIDVGITRSADDLLHIAVRDRGPGIPDDKLEAIFERFQRLEDPQRMRTGGLGLGLYIARHLATAMAGQLQVSSSRRQGTTFTLVLPAATGEQRLTPNGGASLGGSRSTAHRRPPSPQGPARR